MDESPQKNNTSTPAQQPVQRSSPAVPLAIVAGFGLIALAIFFSNGQTPAVTNEKVDDTQETAETLGGEINPVGENDHILGNPNAPIMIVEYSDYDCPYCKNFHETMTQIMDEYGTGGEVAWVYRHFPLEQLHPSAPYIAAASECVAELGGNEAFWKFSDLIFSEREINAKTDTTKLPAYAASAGVDEAALSACLDDGHTRSLVEEDFNDAIRAGAKGTPYSLVLIAGQQFVINGAQQYEYVSNALDTLIEQMNDGTTAE